MADVASDTVREENFSIFISNSANIPLFTTTDINSILLV